MENNDQNECMNVNFEEEINNEETDDMVHNLWINTLLVNLSRYAYSAYYGHMHFKEWFAV